MDQKWSQEEQKIEADRARWLKTAPHSAKEPPKTPKKGYGVAPGAQKTTKSDGGLLVFRLSSDSCRTGV